MAFRRGDDAQCDRCDEWFSLRQTARGIVQCARCFRVVCDKCWTSGSAFCCVCAQREQEEKAKLLELING